MPVPTNTTYRAGTTTVNTASLCLPISASKVTSNAAFLMPSALGFMHGMPLSGLLALLTAAVSTRYHLAGERRGRDLDVSTSWTLILHNAVLLAASGLPYPFTLLALLSLAAALYVFYGLRKDDWEWHTLSAIITASCLLAFVHGHSSPG